MRDYVIPTTLARVAVRRLQSNRRRKDGGGGGRETPSPLARPVLSCAHYLQVPATYAGYHYLKVILQQTIRND